MIISGIETSTFRLVVQYLNQLRNQVPSNSKCAGIISVIKAAEVLT
jgi:hypothetical protein